MKSFSGSLPVVIDTETTGFSPRTNSMIEICVIPLDPIYLDISSKHTLFHATLRPREGEVIDADAIRVQKKKYEELGQFEDAVCADNNILTNAMLNGLDYEYAGTLFHEWFENLKLGPYSRIIPIAHNWVFDQAFISDWLGTSAYNYIFSPLFRDTMLMAIYDSDSECWNGSPSKERYTYKLSALAFRNGIQPKDTHNAMDDCITTAQLYKKLLAKRIM